MKYMQTLITMVISSVVLTLAGSAGAQTLKPCMVTVVRIQGHARYSLGDNVWHPLLVGKVLKSGAIIQTADNSFVDVVFSGNPILMPQAGPTATTIAYAADPNVRGLVSAKPMVQQNVIRLWSNTVLAVDKLTQFDTGVDTVSDTELDLRAGRIFFNIKKISASSKFLIKIPNGVAGIRGSYGFLDASGHMSMGGGSAVISVIGPNGKPITEVINAGSQFNPVGGQVLSVPGSILQNLRLLISAVPTLYHPLVGGPPNPESHIVNISTVYCSPGLGTKQP